MTERGGKASLYVGHVAYVMRRPAPRPIEVGRAASVFVFLDRPPPVEGCPSRGRQDESMLMLLSFQGLVIGGAVPRIVFRFDSIV